MKHTKLQGWGRYPTIEAQINMPRSSSAISALLCGSDPFQGIARGLGRSYGDSSLAEHVISTTHLNHFIDFDRQNGTLHCEAGVSLAEVLDVIVPHGWFLPVTPGTKFITLGGAIASDVHGKNHHVEGSFCDHVLRFDLILPSGEIVTCSPTENSELFHASCGGMGLTGIIIDCIFKLKPITSSMMDETTIKTVDLNDTLEQFDNHNNATYSAAWIDCLSRGNKLGRSLIMLSEHSTQGDLLAHNNKNLSIPCNMPGALLNQHTIKAFNTLYYHRANKLPQQRQVHYESVFYPLDAIHNWNRLYGKAGFTQYQCVIPKEAGLQGLGSVLEHIAKSQQGSFLAVLKLFGKANDNWLSFPSEGYTLAIDFKLNSKLLPLLNELDRLVIDYGGRVYLSKDARMSAQTFKTCYPNNEKFAALRKQIGADRSFHSLQSKRLQI